MAISFTLSSTTYFSQGSVAAFITHGGIFNDEFVANLQRICSQKNFENELAFGRARGKSVMWWFFFTDYPTQNHPLCGHYTNQPSLADTSC